MFKISRLSDYAFVLLSCLAEAEGLQLSATILTQKSSLPDPTVRKVMKILCRGGLVASRRGGQGGYQLVQSPDELSALHILEVCEGDVFLTGCVQGAQLGCAVEDTCRLRGGWDVVNGAVTEAMNTVTLRDMMIGAHPMNGHQLFHPTETKQNQEQI